MSTQDHEKNKRLHETIENLPPASPVAPAPRTKWMIVFDDPDRKPLFFEGVDAENVARATHKKLCDSWTCELFISAADIPLAPVATEETQREFKSWWNAHGNKVMAQFPLEWAKAGWNAARAAQPVGTPEQVREDSPSTFSHDYEVGLQDGQRYFKGLLWQLASRKRREYAPLATLGEANQILNGHINSLCDDLEALAAAPQSQQTREGNDAKCE